MKKDYYDILGVPQDSSKEYIKRAYRLLAHQYHPDKEDGSEKRFKEINEAYLVLSDDQSRKEYDENYNKNKTNSSNYNEEKPKEDEPVEKKEKVKKEPKIDIEKTKKSLKYTGGLIYAVGWLTIVINSIYYILGLFGKNLSDSNLPNPSISIFFITVIISIIYIILGKRIKNLNDKKTKLYLQIVILLSFVFFTIIVITGGAVGILFFILLVYLISSLFQINKIMKVKAFTSTLTNPKYKLDKYGWGYFIGTSLVIFMVLLTIDLSKPSINNNPNNLKEESGGNNSLIESNTFDPAKYGAIPVSDSKIQKQEPTVITTKTDTNKINTSDTSNWITYTSKEDNFSILFPSKPSISTSLISNDAFTNSGDILKNLVLDKPISSIEYFTTDKINKNTYYVTIHTFPSSINNINPNDLLNAILADQTSGLPDGIKIYSKAGSYRQYNLIDATLDGRIYSGEIKIKRLILIGNRVYDIQSYSSSGNYNEEVSNKFIDSFKTL